MGSPSCANIPTRNRNRPVPSEPFVMESDDVDMCTLVKKKHVQSSDINQCVNKIQTPGCFSDNLNRQNSEVVERVLNLAADSWSVYECGHT